MKKWLRNMKSGLVERWINQKGLINETGFIEKRRLSWLCYFFCGFVCMGFDWWRWNKLWRSPEDGRKSGGFGRGKTKVGCFWLFKMKRRRLEEMAGFGWFLVDLRWGSVFKGGWKWRYS